MFDKNWNSEEYFIETQSVKSKVKNYFITAAGFAMLVSLSIIWFINL